MHKGRWTKGRLARLYEIQITRDIPGKLLRVNDRQFAEQIVGMLTVVQCLAVPRFAGLEQKWVTASLFGKKIDTHHEAQTDLGVFVEGMRIHAHEPVWRVDAIVAAPRADIGGRRETPAVTHQHA